MIRSLPLLMTSALLLTACAATVEPPMILETNPQIERLDPQMSALIDRDARWEILSDGYQWAEGPTWDKARSQLYFTDVPGNRAYVWKEGDGTSVWLDPSGADVTEGFREPGANGLFYRSGADDVLLANHGARAVERLDPDTLERETIIGTFEDQRFNSPNDLVQGSDGDIFFTDPPYGLEDLNDSPLKELAFNGVYRLSPEGDVTVLTDSLTFPNGVALSPDEDHLYVAQSDPNAAGVFRLNPEAQDVSAPSLFFDMSRFVGGEHPGLPDGLAIAEGGEIFVTGPGGLFVLSPDGDLLGRVYTGSATANVTFGGEDGSVLFITAQDRLLRLQTKTRAAGWN